MARYAALRRSRSATKIKSLNLACMRNGVQSGGNLIAKNLKTRRSTTGSIRRAERVRADVYSHTVIAGMATMVMTPCSPKPPTTWSPRRLIVTKVPWKTDSNRAEALKPACR
jgi:hypothetical protein